MCNKDLITTINRPTMEAFAWRLLLGEKIEHQMRGVLHQLLFLGENGPVATMQFVEAVALTLDVSPPTARGWIETAVERGYIRSKQFNGNGRVYHYSFREDVREKVIKVGHCQRQIEQVIEAQLASPLDPEAGKHLVPEEIYFNIISQLDRREAAE